MRRLKSVSLVLGLVATAACGTNDGGSTPTSPSAQTYNQSVTGTVGTLGITQHLFSVPRSGNAYLTLSWGNSAVDLDLYLTSSSCVGYPPRDCLILGQSDRPAGTSEEIGRTVSAGESFKVWVDNFSGTSQSYRLDLVIR